MARTLPSFGQADMHLHPEGLAACKFIYCRALTLNDVQLRKWAEYGREKCRGHAKNMNANQESVNRVVHQACHNFVRLLRRILSRVPEWLLQPLLNNAVCTTGTVDP